MSRFSGTLEKQYGIPTVSLANENIVSFGIGAHFKYSTGMPLRFVGVPYPFTGLKKETLKTYLEGKDKVSGKPVMQAIVDCLTKPLTAEEKKTGIPPEAAPEPRFLPPDTEDNLQRLFKDKHWTDYNPIILPTAERVAAMLKGTSHKPDELVKKDSGTFGTIRPFTVEKVAIIAVMAGAKPEYLPVILALSSQVPYMDSTTSNASMVLVNGPIRKQIGMNSGIGALGPNAEANSVIGRAMNLIHNIIQGYQEGVTGFSSLSNPLRYNNVTIAENEEALPEGWKPFHVLMGHKPEDSVLTVLIGLELRELFGFGRGALCPAVFDARLYAGAGGNGSCNTHYGPVRRESAQKHTGLSNQSGACRVALSERGNDRGNLLGQFHRFRHDGAPRQTGSRALCKLAKSLERHVD